MSRVAALWEAWEDEDTLDSPMGPQSALTKRFPDVDLSLWVWAYLGADPTADPSTWPAPVDFTSRLLGEPVVISRGRFRGQRTASAGSCTLVLDNDDGALTPLLPSSSYYPDWDFGVPIQILVDAVGAAPPYSRFCGYLVNVETVIVPTVGGGSTSAVRLTLGGKIRQLTQGSKARSALTRTITFTGSTLLAYWPMEDGADSTVFGSALDGGATLSLTSASLAADSTLAGADALPVFTAATAISGVIAPGTAGTWTVGFYAKYAAAPASLTTLIEVSASAGSADRWVLSADTTTVYIEGFGSAGASAHAGSSTSPYADLFSGEWVYVELNAVNGAAMSVTVALVDTNGGFSVNTSTTITAGYPTRVRTVASAQLDGLAMGHLFADTGFVNFVPFGASSAPTAYVGDRATERAVRVLDEDGIPLTTFDQLGVTLLGAQPVSDTMGILRDLEIPDHGVLSELIDDWGFGYLPLIERYNLDPAMSIDLDTYRVTSGESADVLTPIRNDQRIRNEWTITRTGGSSATAKDTAHQAKKGRYNDSATVNVYADSQVRPEAEWRVNAEGTIDAARYATFPIDLAANNGGADGSDDLLTDWLALDLGARIDRISYPDQHSPDTVSVILEGYTETLLPKSWIVQVNPEPYEPFDVGQYQDLSPLADAPRYDTEWSTTSGAFVTGTDTTMTVATSNGPLWTTGPPGGFPILIRVAGAVLSVTNITGASSPQTFTISTTVANGVVKTIPSGSQVRVYRPGRYAL